MQLDDIESMDYYDIKKPDKHTYDLKLQELDSTSDEINYDEYELKNKEKIDIQNIPPEIKKNILALIMKHDHLFDWNNDKIGYIDIMEHTIQLKPDAKPKRVRPYRLSPLETESLRLELEKLLRLEIIEKGGYSNWASPIIMLKKKDGTYRIVADFRYLNTQNETMNYPLNNIDELLDSLNKAYWMSAFDLRSGFFKSKYQ